jgi:hypothetical protein
MPWYLSPEYVTSLFKTQGGGKCQMKKNQMSLKKSYYACFLSKIWIALLGSEDFKDQSFLLSFFLIVAVLGFLITLRMDSRIKGRVSIGKKLMRKLDLGEYMMGSTGIFTWRHMLIIFYFVMGVYWIYLLIY